MMLKNIRLIIAVSHVTLMAVYLLVLPAQGQSNTMVGMASYYADKIVGRKTASGQIYKHNNLTAAHKTLPFGTKVRVTNLSNKKSVVVVINDRGPFVKGRILDLSKSAAKKLGFIKQGIAKVELKIVK